MARRLTVTDQQARQVLSVLISEGKLRERDARFALARYRKRIGQLRRELQALEGGDAPFPAARRTERRAVRAARPKPVSAKRRKAMKQQGQYLAAVRPLKPQDRAKVKSIRTGKGFAAAIAEARRLFKA
jgi:hypothetical protein